MSARARIVGWMLLLVAVALAASIVATAQILEVRTDEIANDRLEHAAQNFRTFATSPSGRSQHTVAALMTRYLKDTVPNRYETSFSIIDGDPHRRTAGTPPARLDTDGAFVKKVASADKPTSGMVETDAGTVRYATIPVHVVGDSSDGTLVVILFQDALAEPLFESVHIFAVVAALAVVLAGFAGWLVAGRVLDPVRLVRQTADQIGETDLRRRIPVRGRDDVAKLATTFNRMLDRLEAAFETERRFVDDAGHELRTPITVIRGHLELMGADPTERAETMELVTDELARMSRIVDELLTLAKAGQPDFLAIGEVDLADLTVDVLAKARILADRKWALDSLGEGTILADHQRLTQALMQLATNAVQHTGPDDRVSVGSELREDRVLFQVADSGSGVEPGDIDLIFERFRRGLAARPSDGAGLGLSIVRSIAEAHGGTVTVDSRVGEGATFTLDLPRTPRAEPDSEDVNADAKEDR